MNDPVASTRAPTRHTTRWVAGGVLLILCLVGVVLATRTPQEATQVTSPLLDHQAPALAGTDLRTGQPVSLSALRGHYVFVNFFASWCGPCQQETPDLVTFDYNQEHTADGAHLVGVVFHDEVTSARQFQISQGATWPTVNDPGGSIAAHYGVSGPPIRPHHGQPLHQAGHPGGPVAHVEGSPRWPVAG